MVEHRVGYRTQGATDRGDDDLRHVEIEDPFAQEGGGSIRDGGRRVQVAVVALARNAGEQGARRDTARIHGDAVNLGRRIAEELSK
jgi:hypothetical protein